MDPGVLLDRLTAYVRANLPSDLAPEDLDGFLGRYRPQLLEAMTDVVSRLEVARTSRGAGAPDLWTASKRTAANLAAMRALVEIERAGRRPTPAEDTVLAGYSGWGGLSLERVAEQLPPGVPAPEQRGLIHEYYTPSLVCAEVAAHQHPAENSGLFYY